MDYETIGRVSGEEIGEGVSFKLPYGTEEYDINLRDEEMDLLLQKGMEHILGNRALSGFDYIIELQMPELPLFAGARSIVTKARPSGFHTIDMGVSVVTMSHVYEHRGMLFASRDSSGGEWSYGEYQVQPPLKDG